MKKDENLAETETDSNKSSPWIMLSIGAILGAVFSLILSRSNQIKAALRRAQLRREPGLEDELAREETSGLETAAPSPGQPGSTVGGALPTSLVETPSAGMEGSRLEKQAGGAVAPAAVAIGEQASGLSSKTSKPGAMVGATVQALASTRWSTPTRYIMGVFLFLSLLLVIYIGRSAISMVIGAALLALLVDPLIGFLGRRFRMKRNLAVGITYVFVVAVLLLIPLLIIPSLVDMINFFTKIDSQMVAQQLSQVIQSISTTLQVSRGLTAILKPTLDSLVVGLNNYASAVQPEVPGITISASELTSQFGKALGIVTKVLGPTFSALAFIFLTLVISLQMTLTADEVKNWYADLIPPHFNPELSWLLQNVRLIWTGFLRGQMLLMLTVGLITWLGGVILGLPQALLLGIIAGVLELIPNVGPILAAIPAVMLALLFGSSNLEINNLVFALLVIGFYALVQLMENQFLVPRIMGEAVDLPTLVVLIGTIAGAGAFGILGALLATPFIATGNLVFRYVYKKIMEDYFVAPPVETRPGFLDSVKGYLSRLRHSISRKK